MTKISKETNIGYIVITAFAALPCYLEKISWWALLWFPCFYILLWISLRETKKDREVKILKDRLNKMNENEK